MTAPKNPLDPRVRAGMTMEERVKRTAPLADLTAPDGSGVTLVKDPFWTRVKRWWKGQR